MSMYFEFDVGLVDGVRVGVAVEVRVRVAVGVAVGVAVRVAVDTWRFMLLVLRMPM